MTTRAINLYIGKRYAIISYGGGWAYQIADHVTEETAFLEGDDAAIFRERWETAQRVYARMPAEFVISRAVEGAPFEGAQ